MANRTDFRLPGHTLHPLAERKCSLSLLAAYSKQWNPRNLEHPWYEPWGQILAALVAEHSAFSVAPQPYLWYDASLSSQPHTTPGPDYLMSTNGEELDDPVDGVGNDTLDSICTLSVSSTIIIPAFLILRSLAKSHSHDQRTPATSPTSPEGSPMLVSHCLPSSSVLAVVMTTLDQAFPMSDSK